MNEKFGKKLSNWNGVHFNKEKILGNFLWSCLIPLNTVNFPNLLEMCPIGHFALFMV